MDIGKFKTVCLSVRMQYVFYNAHFISRFSTTTGSPFRVDFINIGDLTTLGDVPTMVHLNRRVQIVLGSGSVNVTGFDVRVSGPGRWSYPVQLFYSNDGRYTVEYSPAAVGQCPNGFLCGKLCLEFCFLCL